MASPSGTNNGLRESSPLSLEEEPGKTNAKKSMTLPLTFPSNWSSFDDEFSISPNTSLKRTKMRSTAPERSRDGRKSLEAEVIVSPMSPVKRGASPKMMEASEKSKKSKKFSIIIGTKYSKLKEENKILKHTNDYLIQQLQVAGHMMEKMQDMIQTHPVSQITGVNTVKFNCTETILETGLDPEVADDLLNGIDTLTNQLTSAMMENATMRAEAEAKLKNNQVLLEEMKSSLDACKQLIKQLDSKTSNKLGDIKTILDTMGNDRSDDRLIRECIAVLEDRVVKNKFVKDIAVITKDLPSKVCIATRRILKKFEFFTWEEFAGLLGVDVSVMLATSGKRRSANTEGEKDEMCARCLVVWLQRSESNDEDRLIQLVKDFEHKRCTERSETFQRQTLSNAPTNKQRVLYNRSENVPITHDMRERAREREPDEKSKFRHFLESVQLLISTKREVEKNSRNMTKIMEHMGIEALEDLEEGDDEYDADYV